MKKLLAVLVVFALIMGAVFADVSTGGGLKAQLVGGDSDAEDAEGLGTGVDSWFWLGAGKTNEENTAGAKGSFALAMKPNGTPPNLNQDGDSYFYAWWKPIEQLFIKAGKVGQDGKYWAGADVVEWGFQSNDLLCSPAFNYYNGFAGSMIYTGIGFFERPSNNQSDLQISILPIDGLALNLGWVLGGNFKEAYGQIAVQAVYDIDGVGQAAVGFVNEGEEKDKKLFVQWSMPIDVMKVELGLKFKFNPDVDDYKPPIDAGIGFRYGNAWGDAFWATARVGLSIATADTDPSYITFDVCPSIDLDIFRLYFPVGIGIGLPPSSASDADPIFAWSVNPYIRKAMGGIEFWAGFKLYNGAVNASGQGNWYNEVVDKTSSEKVNWAIPIAFLWAW